MNRKRTGKRFLAYCMICLLMAAVMSQEVPAAGYSPASATATALQLETVDESKEPDTVRKYESEGRSGFDYGIGIRTDIVRNKRLFSEEEASGGWFDALGKRAGELAQMAGKILQDAKSLGVKAGNLLAGLLLDDENEDSDPSDSLKEKCGSVVDSIKEKATEAAGAVKGTVGDTVDAALEKATEAAGVVKDTVSDTVNAALEKATAAAGAVKDTASDTADAVKDTVSDTADVVKDTVSDTADAALGMAGDTVDAALEKATAAAGAVQDTVSDTADAVKDTVDTVQDTVSDVADTVQDTVSETVRKVEESYQDFSDKWSRVLLYLKGVLANTNITDKEWGILRKGFGRAVKNAYRAGWFGNQSRAEVERNADCVFESIRYTYLLAKEEMTPAEYGEAMTSLYIRDQGPEAVGGIISKVTGLDKGTSEMAARGVIWLLKTLAGMKPEM